MATLYLAQGSDEVVAVLDDGVLPGRKVVENPDVWNSRPQPKFRCVHVLGVRASDFSDLMEPDRQEVKPGEFKQVARRKKHLDLQFLSMQEQGDLALQRSIVLAKDRIKSKGRDPAPERQS